jgi:competence protein ComEC
MAQAVVDPGERIGADLRLLPAAVGAEVGAAVGLLLPGRWVVAVVVLAGVAGVAGLTAARFRPAAGVGVALLLVLAGSAAGAGLREQTRRSGPVAEAAARNAAGSVEVVLTGDPRRLTDAARGDALRRESVTVEARLVRLSTAGRSVRTRSPVLVIAPAQGWSGLLPSQHASVDGVLVPPRGSDIAAVVLVRGPPGSVGPASWWQRRAAGLRAGLRRACVGLPSDARGLLPGVVLGDTAGMSDDLTADARTAGLSHLTAVSGANCAIVLAVVLALVRPTPLGRRGRSVFAGLGLVGFVVLARPSPSVLRAALMGLIALLALALGRPRAALPALLGSATLLVLADPDLAIAPGFALSVLATGSLLLVAPGWAEALGQRLPRWAAQSLAVPLAAQAAVIPVLVLLSGSISLVAVPANLLAAPAVPLATVFGVLATVASPVSPWAAHLLATPGGWACSEIAVVAHRSASLPGGSIPWPRTAFGVLLAVVAVLVAVALVRRRGGRRLLTAAVAGLVVAGLLVPRTLPRWPLPSWQLITCDVGQGDALLVRGGGGDLPVLVDAGPDPRLLRTCLDDLGVHRLAAVVLSHLHADHVEGLPAVLGRVSTPVVFVNPLDEPALEGRRVRGWAARARVPVSVLSAGQRWSAGGVSFDVLGPTPVLHGTDSDPNNDSLVLLASAGGLRILFTGDVQKEAQADLLARGVPPVDVFKVPHHGSANQDDRFLGATGARVALTSVGRDNPYGHPNARTMQTVARDDMAVLRTDEDGSVALAAAPGGPRVLPQKRTHGRPNVEAGEADRTAPAAVPRPRASAAVTYPSGQPRSAYVAERVTLSPTTSVTPRSRSPPHARWLRVGCGSLRDSSVSTELRRERTTENAIAPTSSAPAMKMSGK